ncbi:transglycosylase domain-containing protein [Williamsia sterculiae]|uniref:Peptidoglycan glycosyltransferase n=1 Tax=Williamsia sterculiae TaxID=1344003 RepID=A0A1N7FI53_9NOCA|nr:transglycosylase domain-containing protein [Williamsia sterculiae]SIS00032.1 peptidoglycan glycosyltransferase [Williamsia sterculiae]
MRAVAWVVGILGSLIPVGVIVMGAIFLFTYASASVPRPDDIKQNQVATIVDTKGGEIARVVPPEGNRTLVPIGDIPKTVQDAVIAAEDREFASNSGFSVSGLSRAVWGKVTGNEDAGGGSTITQQYVKNALVGDERTYTRKFKELAIATKMSNEWSKDDIMGAYLNTIYFGRGAYGVAAAARTYFNKDIKDINTAQAAVLASSIRSPSYYDPATNLEAAQARWHYVLDGMVSTGALTAADEQKQRYPKVAAPTDNQSGASTSGPNGLIKQQVLAELNSLNISEQQVQTEGLKITTTIDPTVQKAVVGESNDKLEGEPSKLRTAAVSVEPKTGAIRGYFGGNDGNGYDYAQAGLQTGSSFKTFALVAALEQGVPLSKVYSSAPFDAPGGLTVTNSDGESCGSCNLATALKMSLNTVYYRLMTDLNGQARAVADAAHQAGIPESFGSVKKTLQNADGNVEGGVVLGQYPSRVLDMASAYATLAASGVYHAPHFVQKVETADGTVLYERKADKGERRFDAKVADNVTAAMEPIAAYSNGHALDGGSRPSAAKTGTTQLGDTGSNKDAWMVGYTPQLSTAVWVGTDNSSALTNYAGNIVYGSGLPSQIWQAIMDDALENQSIEDFPEPGAIGGVAGVPYEAPATTEEEQQTTRDYSTRTPTQQAPTRTQTTQPQLTLAPGFTIPLPGGNQETGDGDSGQGNSDNNGTGNTGGTGNGGVRGNSGTGRGNTGN